MVRDESKATNSPTKNPASSSPEVAETLGKLLELVPTIPKNGQKLSMVDLLQHVIDYIWDLQTVLSNESKRDGSEHNENSDEGEWEKL